MICMPLAPTTEQSRLCSGYRQGDILKQVCSSGTIFPGPAPWLYHPNTPLALPATSIMKQGSCESAGLGPVHKTLFFSPPLHKTYLNVPGEQGSLILTCSIVNLEPRQDRISGCLAGATGFAGSTNIPVPGQTSRTCSSTETPTQYPRFRQ